MSAIDQTLCSSYELPLAQWLQVTVKVSAHPYESLWWVSTQYPTSCLAVRLPCTEGMVTDIGRPRSWDSAKTFSSSFDIVIATYFWSNSEFLCIF